MSQNSADAKVQNKGAASGESSTSAPNRVQTTAVELRLSSSGRSRASAAYVTAPQPYTLDVPVGTIIYSAIVAHHRLWGHAKRRTTLERATGEAGSGAYNPFETRAAHISVALLASHDRGKELLLRNSLVGFLARVLHEKMEDEVVRELLNGSKSVAPMYFKSSQRGELASANLKWCKTCAAIDFSRDGRTHWYVLHQLPVVTHCHRHYLPLIESCNQCQTQPDNGRRWTLPGDACACISGEGKGIESVGQVLDEGDAYRHFLDDIESTFMGQMPQLRPSAWRAIMEALIGKHGCVERARDELTNLLTRRWSKSREQAIASKINALVVDGSVERELRMLARPRDSLLRLAILRVLKDLLPVHRLSEDSEMPLDLGNTNQLIDHLESRGIPSGAAAMLRAGTPIAEIALATKTSTGVLQRALRGLPTRLQEELVTQRETAGSRPPKPATPFNLPSRPTSDEEKRAILRKKVRYLVDVIGLERRGQITALLGSAREWMLRNDREWIEKNLPKRKPSRGSKTR